MSTLVTIERWLDALTSPLQCARKWNRKVDQVHRWLEHRIMSVTLTRSCRSSVLGENRWVFSDDRAAEYSVMNLNDLPVRRGFRQRGQQMTRIETFTDAAFAIAASLMVIAVGELPANWQEMKHAILGIPAFSFALILMMTFWYGHHVWSRRYGLDDLPTIWLSGLLILLVLVYVYPLKFVAYGFISWLSAGAVPSPVRVDSVDELYALFAIYAAGFMLMALTIVGLYAYAWSRREALQLNGLERLQTRHELLGWGLLAGFGLLSLLLALCLPPQTVPWPGIVFCGLSVVMPAFGFWSSRRVAAAQAVTDV